MLGPYQFENLIEYKLTFMTIRYGGKKLWTIHNVHTWDRVVELL
jgi:hypothetical protein